MVGLEITIMRAIQQELPEEQLLLAIGLFCLLIAAAIYAADIFERVERLYTTMESGCWT